ncbi:tetratricopeptide repeat protein [Sapientia aquatica]|uniref:tetratricopeptide repeat protein n=1 Tax=Sapientia aquatica TaxID=1549640 RepID=UPI001059D149|nr:tetratricopeptide repeat protein [Sapientia aquatica]
MPWIVALLAVAGAMIVVATKSTSNPASAELSLAPNTSSRVTISPTVSAPPTAGVGTSAPASNAGGDMATAVKRLEAKLEKNPQNGDGWLLLARSYNELGRRQDAANAFGKAAALLPTSADLLADWVDARVVSNNRKWDDESRVILKRALAADTKHIKSLELAASEAFDRAAYPQAIEFWKQVLAVAPANSPDAKLAQQGINDANSTSTAKK